MLNIDTRTRFNIIFIASQLIGGMVFPAIIYLFNPNWAVQLLIIPLCILFLFNLFYRIRIKLAYFDVSEADLVYTFRYINVGFFKSKRKKIVLLKKDLVEAQISSSYCGLKHILTLAQNEIEGIAKYPPLNISLLTFKERKLLQLRLQKTVQKNTTKNF